MVTFRKNIQFVFLLLLAIDLLSAQNSVSLEEAIEMSKANHPRLKIAIAEIKRTQSSRYEAWELAPTSFSYSWGQLNGEIRNDKGFEFNQEIGSLIAPYYKNVLVNKKVASGEYYRDIVEKEVVAEVKRAWSYYLFTRQQLDIIREQSFLVEQLNRNEDIKYKKGSITLFEKNVSDAYASDLHNKLFQATEDLKVAATRLQWACYSDKAIVPSDTGIVLLPVSSVKKNSSDVHLEYLKSITEQKKILLQIERSKFFPEFSVGYVRQNILPLKGLHSWMVGVSFPLFFSAQLSRVKQARIDLFIQQTHEEMNARELQHKQVELEADLARQRENIRYYKTTTMPEAELLLNDVRLQLESGNIDIAKIIQTLGGVLSIKKSFIETIYLYNVAVLETELYK